MKIQEQIHFTHEEVRLALEEKFSIKIDRPLVSQQIGYFVVASPLLHEGPSAEEEPIV